MSYILCGSILGVSRKKEREKKKKKKMVHPEQRQGDAACPLAHASYTAIAEEISTLWNNTKRLEKSPFHWSCSRTNRQGNYIKKKKKKGFSSK